MKVADQIKSRMEQLGITVPELARRAKCSPQPVRFWLAGVHYGGKEYAYIGMGSVVDHPEIWFAI